MLSIDGRNVWAKVLNFSDCGSGRPYLFYLKFIPKTKAYRVDSRNYVPLFGPPVDDPALEDATKWLEDTRAAVSVEAGKSEGDWNTSVCAGGESAQRKARALG